MHKSTKANHRFSAAQVVFDTIVEQLEKGNAIWVKPWVAAEKPLNVVSKRQYSGFNSLFLNHLAGVMGWETNRYLTFKQAKELGGKVKKGEKGTMVVYWELIPAYAVDAEGKVMIDENGKKKYDAKRKYFMSRYYHVFNIAQCEGLPDEMYAPTKGFDTKQIKTGEDILALYKDKPSIVEGGDVAAYVPSMDIIKMPLISQFKSADRYYSTLFHECVHSTGAKKRLDRDMKGGFGSSEYALEELVAEIGAAVLMNEAGLEINIEDSGAYCRSWLKAVKGMKDTALMKAFNQAWKAVSYIKGEPKEGENTKVA